jgi:hypothetical protein
MQDDRGDGGVLDPDIADRGVRAHDNPKGSVFQKGGSMRFALREGGEQGCVRDKHKMPGVQTSGRRGTKDRLLEGVNDGWINGSILEHPDASAAA